MLAGASRKKGEEMSKKEMLEEQDRK